MHTSEVKFEVREDLYGPNRELLVMKGADAFGKVVTSKGRGAWGKSGKLEFSCDYLVAVDGSKVSLRSDAIQKKGGNTGSVVATTVLAGVFGAFVKGKDVKAEKGTEFTMFVGAGANVDASKAPAGENSPSGEAAVAVTTTRKDGSTYSLEIPSSVVRDLAQKIGAKVSLDSSDKLRAVAIMDFELIPERETLKLDTTVARNVREDLTTAMAI